MMEHYGHVRMDVKRKALEGLSPVVVATEPTSKPPGHAWIDSMLNWVLNCPVRFGRAIRKWNKW